MDARTVLVTGAAGFIGSHTAEALLKQGRRVLAVDNFNDYYDPARKHRNVADVRAAVPDPDALELVAGDIRDHRLMRSLFDQRPAVVVHLAAMAGVRASIEDPELYYDVNVRGTLNLVQLAIQAEVGHFILASTSSVYGRTDRIPFIETDTCDRPISPYSASKRAAEMLAFTYHHLQGLNVTVLRFFTVYGPRGRPDMMAYKVLDSIDSGRQVPLFNAGRMHRDWTYVDDVVAGVVTAADRPLGYEAINLGRGEPVLLADFVRAIEKRSGKRANLVPAPMPDADVSFTFADVGKAERLLDYHPLVSVEEGIDRFWKWYRSAVRR